LIDLLNYPIFVNEQSRRERHRLKRRHKSRGDPEGNEFPDREANRYAMPDAVNAKGNGLLPTSTLISAIGVLR